MLSKIMYWLQVILILQVSWSVHLYVIIMKSAYLKELETCILYFLYSGLQVDEAELSVIIFLNAENIYDEHLIKIYLPVTERFLTNQ